MHLTHFLRLDRGCNYICKNAIPSCWYSVASALADRIANCEYISYRFQCCPTSCTDFGLYGFFKQTKFSILQLNKETSTKRNWRIYRITTSIPKISQNPLFLMLISFPCFRSYLQILYSWCILFFFSSLLHVLFAIISLNSHSFLFMTCVDTFFFYDIINITMF